MTDEEADLEIEIERERARALKAKAAPAPLPQPMPSEPGTFDAQTKVGTGLRGFGQGASAMFSDELAGLAGAQQELMARGNPLAAVAGGPLSTVANAPVLLSAGLEQLRGGPGVKGLADRGLEGLGDVEAAIQRYRADRDRARRELDVGRKANPKTAMASELAGAVTMPGPKVTRIGAVPLTRAGSMAASGAAQGVMAGAGASREESLGGVLEDAVTMGGINAVANPVLGGLARAAGAGLERLGVGQALKALGGRAGISDSLGRAGVETAEEGQALAKRALDEGLVRPGRTAEDIARQAAEKQEFGANPVIADVMERANQGTPFDFDEAGWDAAKNLMLRKRSVPGPLNPQEQKTGAEAMRMVKRISETQAPEGTGSFSEANRLKQDLYDAINWKADAPLSTEMQRKAASGLRQSIEDQASRSLGPEDAAALKAANERWGFSQTVKDLATEEARRQAQRQVPWFKIAAGGAAAGAPGAIAGSLVGSPRATSAAAVGAHGLGKQLSGEFGQSLAGAPGRSIADPLGPLRQFLQLDAEEQRNASADAYGSGQ